METQLRAAGIDFESRLVRGRDSSGTPMAWRELWVGPFRIFEDRDGITVERASQMTGHGPVVLEGTDPSQVTEWLQSKI